MKTKDFRKEIQTLSQEELSTRAKALAEELMKLRFRAASGQLEQSHRLGQLRRNLARVRTELTKRYGQGTATA